MPLCPILGLFFDLDGPGVLGVPSKSMDKHETERRKSVGCCIVARAWALVVRGITEGWDKTYSTAACEASYSTVKPFSLTEVSISTSQCIEYTVILRQPVTPSSLWRFAATAL
jgi:hypothetical protein